MAAAAAVAALGPLAAAPSAQAATERMQLFCADGRVLERTNGTSWWGADGAGYVHERVVVTADGQVLYAQDAGRKAPDAARTTCVAEHFGTVWTVDLVQVR